MVHYYLDIETFGTGKRPDPATDEIITITYCAVDPITGRQLQPPVILKSWESSEKAIVRQFAERFLQKNPFSFIPVGFSLLYDLWFLKHKFNKYVGTELDEQFFMNQPFIDLKQVMVFRNGGQFKGVRIGAEGNPVRDWFQLEDYESIERYVNDKLEIFLEAWRVNRV